MIMDKLSDAQVLLLAVRLTTVSRLDVLYRLAGRRQNVLSNSLLLRILLSYLPLPIVEADVQNSLLLLLQAIESNFTNFSSVDGPDENDDISEVPDSKEAEKSLGGLKLDKVPIYQDAAKSDPLTDYIIAYTHQLDESDGVDASTLALIEHFSSCHETLRHWDESFLKPFYRLRTEYYPDRPGQITLLDLEHIHGESGVAKLLDLAAQSREPANLSRDLSTVVGPWIQGSSAQKRRKLSATDFDSDHDLHASSWTNVNKWLFSKAQTDYDLVAAGIEQWDGPATQQGPNAVQGMYLEDQIEYVRTTLALIYSSGTPEDTNKLVVKKRLLTRATALAQLMPPDFETQLPEISSIGTLQKASRTDLLPTTLLTADNPLSRPSTAVIDFLYGVLSTQAILASYKIDSTTSSVAALVLFDSPEKQNNELRNILAQVPRLTKSTTTWSHIRQTLLWLHSWGNISEDPPFGYLSRLDRHRIEKGLLDTMLSMSCYEDIRLLYIDNQDQPLTVEQVQACVLDTILASYDNASNGNRTRGGVKKAVEMISAFKTRFPDKARFEEIEHLIKATHSLSFYQLTLQHGVPFQPVSIRVASDPLSLIEKALDQNSKAYARLDDFLEIARNLVLAGLVTASSSDYAPGEEVPLERRLFDAERRVIYSAIIAALTDHDFDTAYSLITTRLGSTPITTDGFVDDTTWRAAYAAGRHQSTASSPDIHTRIASLQKRMELLSKALTLAPTPDPLLEILEAWRKCEEELDLLKSQALEEERAIEAQSETLIPGGFGPSDRDLDANETRRMLESRRFNNTTGPSYEEEAPMGLFDVARGAASALRKNAFPLRGGPQVASAPAKTRSQPRQSMDDGLRSSSEFERPDSADGQRVRKRDMLSNAVTGGLVSGMSWVLGAQPTQAGGQEQR